MSPLQKIIAAIRSRFQRRRKLERITSSFRKTINDLNNLHVSNRRLALKNALRVDAIQRKNLALHIEAADAARIATKIEGLLG